MAEREPLAIPDDPLEWAPMRAYDGRRNFEIRDPLVEPLWSGTRVLAHVRIDPDAELAATVRLIEELGADVAPELPELTRALGEGVLALEAIIGETADPINAAIHVRGPGGANHHLGQGRSHFTANPQDHEITGKIPHGLYRTGGRFAQ